MGERHGWRHWVYSPHHPYLAAINRMAAGEWLLTGGDTTQAVQLLTWHEAVLWGRMKRARMANRLMEPIAYLRRARIAQAQGQSERAREHYRAFLVRYDMPPEEHRAWILEAETTTAGSSEGSPRYYNLRWNHQPLLTAHGAPRTTYRSLITGH